MLPWSCKQILAYCFYSVYSFSYNFLMWKASKTLYHQVDQICFNTLIAISFCFHLLTSSINPVDPLVLRQTTNPEGDEAFFKCNICKSEINLFSRHCLICNKCVYQFDHHCKWVNNCIGKANYKYFILLLISTTILSGFRTGIGINALQLAFSNKGLLEVDSKVASVSFVLVLTLVSLIIWIYTIYLLCFHINLIRKGVTTFEYIAKKKAIKQSKIVPRVTNITHEIRCEGGISMQTEVAGFSFNAEIENN